jgi:hypothetical protein
MWRTSNISMFFNKIGFDPSKITGCNANAWSDCGAGGIFSEYGGPSKNVPGWAIPTQLTFFQGNIWRQNSYQGPSTFYVWNQGNGDSPISWANWTGRMSVGDQCRSSAEQQSGYCTGPFGQDPGSSYQYRPPA